MSSQKDMLLMFGDVEVMRINFDTGRYDVLSNKYLPYGLRGKLRKVLTFSEIRSEYDLTQMRIATNSNYNAVIHWIANRTLLLSRENAKWIYNALSIEQKSDDVTRFKIALVCRAVSVLDKYWVKIEGDKATWKTVNIKENKLNEVIAQIALHGKSLTLQGPFTTPELTTNGAYAKAWRRHDDGTLWLYKLGHRGSVESKIEVMVSNILDRCNVDHVHYEAGEDEGKYVCMCPCISTDSKSIIPASEVYSYCNVNGVDFDSEIMRLSRDDFYKMHIVDYLISNRDRHLDNWGFYVDNDTMELIGLHPLFDHNNAFDINYMQNEDEKYLVNSKSIRSTAEYAMREVDFHFTKPITRDLFITERQYKSFTSRADKLGIKTICGQFNAASIMSG